MFQCSNGNDSRVFSTPGDVSPLINSCVLMEELVVIIFPRPLHPVVTILLSFTGGVSVFFGVRLSLSCTGRAFYGLGSFKRESIFFPLSISSSGSVGTWCLFISKVVPSGECPVFEVTRVNPMAWTLCMVGTGALPARDFVSGAGFTPDVCGGMREGYAVVLSVVMFRYPGVFVYFYFSVVLF